MKWELAEQREVKKALALSEKLDMPSIVSQILVNRGMDKQEDIECFFNPTLERLTDPFLLPNIDIAVERILRALRNKERMVIFGDYDVDGLTATALMYSVLSGFGAEVDWFLPDRLEDGYGLNKSGIDDANEWGAKLIVSVDCGITGIEEVAYAKELGIDSVITDHHEPGHELPDAYAVVDPKLLDVDTKNRELAGVGVAFKLCQALFEKIGIDKADLYNHLDLVGLGTIADIVPLVGENRILAKYGLRTLEATQKPGLKELLRITGLWGNELSSWHVVFVLAPRLNAVGRIGDPALAFKLLTTHDRAEARDYAKQLDSQNEKRKMIDTKIFDEAIEMVNQHVDLSNDRAIVLDSDEWHTGVIGIVASRLVEKFHRPSIMISTQDGDGKGSARSINHFHILDAIKDSEDILVKYGGHKYAAGLSIKPEQIPTFRQQFNKYTAEHLQAKDMVPRQHIDAEVFSEEISMTLMKWLEKFSPYGPNNQRPVFALKNAEIAGYPQIVGKSHLKMQVKIKNGKRCDVIGFNMAKYHKKIIETKESVNLAFVMEMNHYYGYPKLQLRLKDLKIGEWIE
ncbi:MAG: single-stranded-DNA-specific exonuclease RecJ [Candidatus Zixiibacteriota bacterium]